MDAVTVGGGLVPFKFQANERVLRVCLALNQSVLADEILVAVEHDGEADPSLERINLVIKLIAGEDKAGFNPNEVERVEPERRQPERLPGLPDCVPNGAAILGVAEDLIAKLSRVAGPRNDHWDPVVVANPAYEETEPLQILKWRLGLGRPNDLLQNVATGRALNGNVVQLVG